jgi:hypothetical protein
MIKVFVITAMCSLFVGCASSPDRPNDQQKVALADQEEAVEQTGSHLKRKRQSSNMDVIDRAEVERAGRPRSAVTTGK